MTLLLGSKWSVRFPPTCSTLTLYKPFISNILRAASFPVNPLALICFLYRENVAFTPNEANAALSAALLEAQKNENKNIVVILPDTGSRYFSTKLFSE